jgi:hypothetical protein
MFKHHLEHLWHATSDGHLWNYSSNNFNFQIIFLEGEHKIVPFDKQMKNNYRSKIIWRTLKYKRVIFDKTLYVNFQSKLKQTCKFIIKQEIKVLILILIVWRNAMQNTQSIKQP